MLHGYTQCQLCPSLSDGIVLTETLICHNPSSCCRCHTGGQFRCRRIAMFEQNSYARSIRSELACSMLPIPMQGETHPIGRN